MSASPEGIPLPTPSFGTKLSKPSIFIYALIRRVAVVSAKLKGQHAETCSTTTRFISFLLLFVSTLRARSIKDQLVQIVHLDGAFFVPWWQQDPNAKPPAMLWLYPGLSAGCMWVGIWRKALAEAHLAAEGGL